MSGVARTRWAWLLAAYAVAGVASRLGLGVGPPHDTAADQVLVPLVLPVVGAACLLLVRLPGHGVTRVLTLVAVATVTRQWLDVVQDRVDGPVADRMLDALAGIAWTGEVPALSLLVLLFPTGRPPGPRWRVVLRAQLAALGLLVVVAVVLDTTSPLIPFVAAPAGLVLLATTTAAVWSLVQRWRRGDPDERAGMRGFVLLAVVLVACYAISGTAAALGLPAPVADGLWSLLLAGLPVAVAYGVLRHRLYDIEVVVRRVAVWAVLSAALLGIYLGVAVGIDTLLGGRRGIDLGTLVAAAVVALGLAPLRRLLQVGVDRLLYGRRGDPDDMVRRAARELAAAGAAADVPQRLAELLTTSLRLPWTAVELDREGRWERVAQTGTVEPAPEVVLVVAMSTAGEVPARLLVSARRGERLLSSRDRAVLDDLAVQLAPALLSVRLVDELERSRERLLRAGIEERQRLRHDLHDTLSPALGGMRLALDAARRLLPTDPDRADVLLAAVRAETERTGDAVHTMLARLRPAPIGDADADLLAAVVAHGDHLAERAGLQVEVGAEGLLPTLPPAVIEAAYRIAVEAMTNTARHATARRCTVRLRAAEDLTVEVNDDGCGLPEPPRPGVGWESMRRRADELGGRCEIAAAVGGGTRVLAVLPLAVRP